VTFIESLRAIPPGSLVPRDWVLSQLEMDRSMTAPDGSGDLSIGEVAERTRRADSTVRAWLNHGLFPGAYKLRGRDWRIPQTALQAFLEEEATGKGTRRNGQRTGTVDLAAWREEVGTD
jgi:excisionase family DNA binding protein